MGRWVRRGEGGGEEEEEREGSEQVGAEIWQHRNFYLLPPKPLNKLGATITCGFSNTDSLLNTC